MWIFLVIITGLIVAATILTEREDFGWATFLLLVGVVVAQFFHVADLLGWVKTHGIQTIIYVFIYVGMGVAWSFVKWFSFLLAFRDRFRAWKAEFLSKLTPPLGPDQLVPQEFMSSFESFLIGKAGYGDNTPYKRPRAVNNKSRIVSWMSLWPCSVIGTVLNDPVRRLFTFIFNWFKGLYQKMSDAIFRDDAELK